jgi:hypothetical protein
MFDVGENIAEVAFLWYASLCQRLLICLKIGESASNRDKAKYVDVGRYLIKDSSDRMREGKH